MKHLSHPPCSPAQAALRKLAPLADRVLVKRIVPELKVCRRVWAAVLASADIGALPHSAVCWRHHSA